MGFFGVYVNFKWGVIQDLECSGKVIEIIMLNIKGQEEMIECCLLN